MEKIIPIFEESLFNPSLRDVTVEMIEFGIDSILDEGLIKNIPIVRLLIGGVKTMQNIHERNLLVQTLGFIKSFNKQMLTQSKIDKYREKLQENNSYAQKELGRVIFLLNINIDLRKSEILGRLYSSFVNQDIDWHLFCELSDVNSRLYISDIEFLRDVYNNEISNTKGFPVYKFQRMIGLGLIDASISAIYPTNTSAHKTDYYVTVSELGNLYCRFGGLE